MNSNKDSSAHREQESEEMAIHDWFMQYVIKPLLKEKIEDNIDQYLKVLFSQLQINFKQLPGRSPGMNIDDDAKKFLRELVKDPTKFSVFPETFPPMLREKIMKKLEEINGKLNA